MPAYVVQRRVEEGWRTVAVAADPGVARGAFARLSTRPGAGLRLATLDGRVVDPGSRAVTLLSAPPLALPAPDLMPIRPEPAFAWVPPTPKALAKASRRRAWRSRMSVPRAEDIASYPAATGVNPLRLAMWAGLALVAAAVVALNARYAMDRLREREVPAIPIAALSPPPSAPALPSPPALASLPPPTAIALIEPGAAPSGVAPAGVAPAGVAPEAVPRAVVAVEVEAVASEPSVPKVPDLSGLARSCREAASTRARFGASEAAGPVEALAADEGVFVRGRDLAFRDVFGDLHPIVYSCRMADDGRMLAMDVGLPPRAGAGIERGR